MDALRLVLVCTADWMNRNQQLVIEYLQEEVKILKEILEQFLAADTENSGLVPMKLFKRNLKAAPFPMWGNAPPAQCLDDLDRLAAHYSANLDEDEQRCKGKEDEQAEDEIFHPSGHSRG